MATSSFIRCSVAPLPSVAAPSSARAKLHHHITATTSSTTGRGDVQLSHQLASGRGRGRDDEAREDHGADHVEEEQAWSRRGLMGATAAALAVASQWSCEPAVAFDLGISGPKEWLRGQKRKTAQFLLNPIEASRNRLSTAALLLSSAEGSSFENYEEAGRLVKVAARDCTPSESGSILDFQTRTGVEVCTFKLVLKNAASLLQKDDPVKLSADAALQDLIRSFVAVDALFASGGTSAATQRDDILSALKETMVALDTFQQGVQNCLDA